MSDTGAADRRRGGVLMTVGRTAVLLALLGAGGGAAWHWWLDRQAHVYVVDARIASDMVTLSAASPGFLVQLDAVTGQRVPRGHALARLDTRHLDLRLEELRGELGQLRAEAEHLASRRRLVAARTASAAAMAQAQLDAERAEHRAATALRTRAGTELARAESLFTQRVIAAQEVENARTVFESASERRLQLGAAVAQAEARLQAAQVERQELEVLDAEAALVAARSDIVQARLRQVEVEREDRHLVSEFDAVVDRTFAEVGEYLRAGARVLMLHDPDNVWVAANVKETELGRFDVGARAVVRADAFPDRPVEGTVAWIGPSATSQFALIPDPNPSGNFTKVTQRVPVRIDIDAGGARLSPGMMVEVSIDAARP